MGAFFIGGQVYEYTALVREGITLQTDYGSVFYLTTGFHGLHVTGGLIAFLFVLGRTYVAKRFTHDQATQRDRRVVLLALRRHRVDRPVLDHLPDPVSGRPVTSDRQDARRTPAGRPSSPPVRDVPRCCVVGLIVHRRPVRDVSAAGTATASSSDGDPSQIAKGRQLFLEGCSTCHGINAQGGIISDANGPPRSPGRA